MNKKLHVHFMGIGGSGMAPIAVIAKKLGFEVSGCDIANQAITVMHYVKVK
jgi:UDP-N-acetylmuramate--alanine ligase